MNVKKVGARLVALRGNLSQNEMSERLGISSSALAMYERGERIPRDEVKERIAHHFGLTVGDLFFEEVEH